MSWSSNRMKEKKNELGLKSSNDSKPLDEVKNISRDNSDRNKM